MACQTRGKRRLHTAQCATLYGSALLRTAHQCIRVAQEAMPGGVEGVSRQKAYAPLLSVADLQSDKHKPVAQAALFKHFAIW